MQKYALKYGAVSLTVKKFPTSRRMRLIVHKDGSVVLTCPKRSREKEIEKFIEINYAWITETVKKSVSLSPQNNPSMPQEDTESLKLKAREYIPQRLEELARLNGLTYKELSIGSAKTKWGSCSRDGRIRISCFVMLLTKEQIDYVLLHELCHLIHFNHSAAFHRKLDEMLPGHNEKEIVREIKKITLYNQK